MNGAWTEGEAKERGVTAPASLKYQARIELLTARIHDQITQPAAESVTPDDVTAYVAAHPRSEPERRKVRVLTRPPRHAHGRCCGSSGAG